MSFEYPFGLGYASRLRLKESSREAEPFSRHFFQPMLGISFVTDNQQVVLRDTRLSPVYMFH